MKKIIITILMLLVASPAHAMVYGFMDGQYYGEDYQLKYICFMDDTCLGVDNLLYKRYTWEVIPLPTLTLLNGTTVTADPVTPEPTNKRLESFKIDGK